MPGIHHHQHGGTDVYDDCCQPAESTVEGRFVLVGYRHVSEIRRITPVAGMHKNYVPIYMKVED